MYKYLEGKPESVIEFNPKTYECHRAKFPPCIDGDLTKDFWKDAPWTDEFEDICGNRLMPAPYLRTRVKMLWDDDNLYIGAYLDEDKIWGTLTERESVICANDDFEVFIDPDGDTHTYFEFEMNALNTVWDLLITKPYRDEGAKAINGWDIAGLQNAVHIDGALNDPSRMSENRGWSVEIMMPWKALCECAPQHRGPKPGEYWRIDFSRVEYRTEVRDGKYAKMINPETGHTFPEDNWIWSPIGVCNMHYPELWGFLHFQDESASIPALVVPDDEYLKWELRKVYYMQKYYFRENGRYADRIEDLCGDETPAIHPVIETTSTMYEARIPTADGKGEIGIRNDSLVFIRR